MPARNQRADTMSWSTSHRARIKLHGQPSVTNACATDHNQTRRCISYASFHKRNMINMYLFPSLSLSENKKNLGSEMNSLRFIEVVLASSDAVDWSALGHVLAPSGHVRVNAWRLCLYMHYVQIINKEQTWEGESESQAKRRSFCTESRHKTCSFCTLFFE